MHSSDRIACKEKMFKQKLAVRYELVFVFRTSRGSFVTVKQFFPLIKRQQVIFFLLTLRLKDFKLQGQVSGVHSAQVQQFIYIRSFP